jgi:AbrB family looped-hinge helix DNA binding protein
MKANCATLTSKGQLVIPVELRRKYKIKAGTRIQLLEDQFGRIVLQPLTEDYIDKVMGILADGPDLLAGWEKEHREEGKHDK